MSIIHTRRAPVNFVTIGLVGLLTVSSLWAQKNTNIAHVRPEAIIPFMVKAPSIDGRIDPDEWQTMHVARFVAQRAGARDMLQPRAGEFWVGCDGKQIYFAVRSAVHPEVGVKAEHEPVRGMDASRAIHDDSVEFWIDTDPTGGKGRYFQVMLNPLGAIYDAMHDRRDGSTHLWWRAEGLHQAHSVADGIWVVECAIPLRDLEITDASGELGIRVCRNYKRPWDQSRWAPGVIAFDSAETMSRVRFTDDAPIVSEQGFQDADGINVRVSVTNPTASPMPVNVRLGYNAEQQPRYGRNDSVVLKPGQSQLFAYRKPLFSSENYPALAEIHVVSGKHTVYHRDVRWHTQPKRAWDRVNPPTPDEAVAFNIEWHPTPRLLRWRIDYATLPKRLDVKRIRLSIRDSVSDKAMRMTEVAPPARFATEQKWQIDDLPDGRFVAALTLEDVDGEVLVKKNVIFDHSTSFAWLNNDIGISDKIIPPFKPLSCQGNTVKAVLRSHTMNAAGLWDQVHSLDEALLAKPMTFKVTQGDKSQELEGAMQFTSIQPHRVVAKANWQAGALSGTTISAFDYDGAMKVTLDLHPTAGQTVEAMELVIPMSNRHFPLMHACGDGLRMNYAGRVPDGEGIVWTSAKASRRDLVGTFLPYLWVGGVERGLCWFASTDEGWVLDDFHVPSLALERRDSVLYLRVRLIQKPTIIKEKRRIVFGLMATPAKPQLNDPDWREVSLGEWGNHDVHLLGMCMYWGGDLYSVFPQNRDFTIVRKLAETRKLGQRDDAFFDAYLAKHPGVHREVKSVLDGGRVDALIPYTNLRGGLKTSLDWRVYQDEWRRGNFNPRETRQNMKKGPIDFSVVLPRSRQDFLLYHYREFLRHGFDAIYWDNIYLFSNDNHITGKGYTREDGLYQPEADIWRIRELTKRAAVLGHEFDQPNLMMAHSTNAYIAPVFSWTGITFGWEWKYGSTDFQDRFTREYIQTVNTGRQAGTIPTVLNGHTFKIKDGDKRTWVERTRFGVAVTHGLVVHEPDRLYKQLMKHLVANGMGTNTCRTYYYWEAEPVAQVQGMETSWVIYDTPKQLILVLCDWDEGGSAKVKLDHVKLRLPADFRAVDWERQENTFTARDGRFETDTITKHDFRVFLIDR